MPAAMNQIEIPQGNPAKIQGGNMDHSKIKWINNPNVRCNDKFISLHNLKPSNPYSYAVKTKNHPDNTHSVMTTKNVRINDKSPANESDFPMWLNLRQQYGTGDTTPPTNACAGAGPGNTTKGVPPSYQYYLPAIQSHPGDRDWDACNKTGLDLTKNPPTNPNPMQSYFGIYDRAVKRKIQAMKSPNMNIG